MIFFKSYSFLPTDSSEEPYLSQHIPQEQSKNFSVLWILFNSGAQNLR